ncbi:13262_t:CDS:2 [Acaulospora colombiana]|uniref:13262_t:CDS:1 n=1 Tax=Acaulospora colombiana TaxID=27376 RepID=A0ACA9KV80_9GLOM|nr:13262_t:CDS:2 [Acaulospora colombiana]
MKKELGVGGTDATALQSTVESMQAIADMYDSYTKETVIPWIEDYKEYNQPATNYEPLIDMHYGTYKKYKEVSDENLSQEQSEDSYVEAIRSRCDTVFNVTLAEVNRIHEERVRDFQEGTKQYLDGQIEFHEKVLEELRQARANFDEPHYSALAQTPRTSSSYEALINEQQLTSSRPVSSVGSMSDVVGGVVDSVGSMGSFFKKTARTSVGRSSIFDSLWGK